MNKRQKKKNKKKAILVMNLELGTFVPMERLYQIHQRVSKALNISGDDLIAMIVREGMDAVARENYSEEYHRQISRKFIYGG